MKNTVTRTDGTKSSNRAKITNISVSENYTTSKEDGYEVIKIGSSNQTITGRHSYTIKYTYNIGKDPLKNADELYYNLIGDKCDTSISNVTFRITMPKSFDKSLLGFSSGVTDSTNSSNVSYSVNGNVISGTLTNTLSAGQSLTVRLTLPEGYFVGASSNIDVFYIVVIIISLVCVLIADRLWAKYGKDDEVVETVEFYPPEGYNSAEVGFLYNGYSDKKSIISLLIYLADKGYLKIEEISENKQDFIKLSNEKKQEAELKVQELENKIREEKLKDINSPKIKIWENSLQIYKNIDKPIECELSENEKYSLNNPLNKSKDKFRIVALKEYDGNDIYEREFFRGLFYENQKTVNESELYNKFYITIDNIIEMFKYKKSKIFEESANKKKIWLIIMSIIIMALITIKPVMEYSTMQWYIILPFIGLLLLFFIGTGKKETKTKIFGLICGFAFVGIPWISVTLSILTTDIMYLTTSIVGIISIGVMYIFSDIMTKRTAYGNEMLGKIRGFKKFLETAEKPQLESLVAQNPEYFYNILPYTYALGVSDVWIKQFETIALQEPTWYDSSNNFNENNVSSFMNTTMQSISRTMTSKPSDNSNNSSGSSSGGGSAGGGSGGGGVGSW